MGEFHEKGAFSEILSSGGPPWLQFVNLDFAGEFGSLLDKRDTDERMFI
jgi:hypothetical protein